MAKKESVMNKKGEDKKSKTSRKAKVKEARKIEAMAIKNEKKKLDEKIDSLQKMKKTTKDKSERKALSKEITEVKKKKSNVGKKDTFIGDVIAEMRLVRWPSRLEMVKYSVACLVFVIFFALFFFGFDALFALVKDLIS